MSLLVVLDNFEHLVAASAELAHLLTNAPGLVVVATSRAAVRVRWERLYEVAPLPDEASLELFVDRARAARADFTLSAPDAAVVRDICARGRLATGD